MNQKLKQVESEVNELKTQNLIITESFLDHLTICAKEKKFDHLNSLRGP